MSVFWAFVLLNGGVRATDQEQKGSAGSSEVRANFARIRWGTAPNPDHDLGTDLFLMARDRRFFDLGLMVGAQVKAGYASDPKAKYFKGKVKDRSTGGVIGWTFRDTREHFEYWLGHQLPHLVVLHDLDTKTSYWVHVTADRVKYTKKGAKIFVPAANTVDPEHLDALLEVAASKVARAEWEGSAWIGAGELAPSRQLRYALLTPRLVAPHPNQGAKLPLTAAQALALLVQVRIHDVERRTDNDDGDAARDASYGWQLVDAFRSFLEDGKPEEFDSLSPATAAEPYEQAAASILHAAALVEDGRPDRALALLDAQLSEDRLDPVDHAWVQVQHARILIELGRLDEARDELLPLIGFASQAPGDVTAAALAGAAANLALAAADWDLQDIGATIAAADTVASWWRQQTVSWGLAEQARGMFDEWARESSIQILHDDPAWRHLRSATLMAGLLGDHAAWRRHSSQLGMHMLTARAPETEVETVEQALTTLRVAGDHKATKLAARRIRRNGPAVAVELAVERVSPATSTRTTAHADLRLLIEAAEVMSETQVAEVVDWAVRTYADPTGYLETVRPQFLVHYELLELLAALVPPASPADQGRICDFVLGQPPVEDQGVASYLARLVPKIPDQAWTPDRAQQAAGRADGDNSELRFPLLAAAARLRDDVRERLQEEASQGSLEALGALRDVRILEPRVVEGLVSHLSAHVAEEIAHAQAGTIRLSTHDYGRDLALLNFWHPEYADWDSIYTLLREGQYGVYLDGPLKLLAGQVPELPDEVVGRLRPLARAVADAPPPTQFFFPVADARSAALALLTALERRQGEPERTSLAALVSGDAASRREAAGQCGDPTDATALGVLLALAGDAEPEVRAQAAVVIAERAVEGDVAARAQLPRLARDPGVLVPSALARVALSDSSGWLLNSDELRELGGHLSHTVRATFSSPSTTARSGA